MFEVNCRDVVDKSEVGMNVDEVSRSSFSQSISFPVVSEVVG